VTGAPFAGAATTPASTTPASTSATTADGVPAGGVSSGAAAGGSSPEQTATGPTLRSSTRAARGPLVVALALVVAGAVVGLLSLQPSGALDPDAYDPAGSRAVAELLRGGGVTVDRVGTVEQVQAGDDETSLTVLAVPQGLAAAELEQLGQLTGSLLVVAPSSDDLEALGLPAQVAGEVDVDVRLPGCDFGPAERAGDADIGGTTYAPTGTEAIGCYSSQGGAGLLVLPEQRAVLLGTGTPLTNDRLDERGNAALTLGMLGGADRVLWLMPDPGRAVPPGEQRPLTELMPDWLLLGLLQLGIAVVVLALWRARRLGRVVEEPLPVVVRAAEATEGRGRLYRAAHARGPAAEALRAGVRERAAHRLGQPASDRSGLVAGAAARTGQDPVAIDSLLYGAPPADDAGLVGLADALRALERELVPPPRGRPPHQPDRGADRS
jgi:hypothetical protein